MTTKNTTSCSFTAPRQQRTQLHILSQPHDNKEHNFMFFHSPMTTKNTTSCPFTAPWQQRTQLHVLSQPHDNKEHNFMFFHSPMTTKNTTSCSFTAPRQQRTQLHVLSQPHDNKEHNFMFFHSPMTTKNTTSCSFTAPWQQRTQLTRRADMDELGSKFISLINGINTSYQKKFKPCLCAKNILARQHLSLKFIVWPLIHSFKLSFVRRCKSIFVMGF